MGEKEDLKIPEKIDEYNVTSICDSAFSDCSGLTSVNIPLSITQIENEVFQGCCSLTNIDIPLSVMSIGYCAFEGCSNLSSIQILNPDCEIYD